MKTIYLPALAVFVIGLATGAVCAQQMPDYYTNYDRNISPPQYVPAGAGAGQCNACPAAVTPCPVQSTPACPGCGPVVVGYPASDCCNVADSRCGAFCTAGQTSPGWPYNFCSEYWLRPDSNF